MAQIKKDTSITPISVTKTRKKLTGLNYDNNSDVITISYDIIALDNNGNEIYIVSQGNSKHISQDRFSEPLIAAWIQASKDMIQNEF